MDVFIVRPFGQKPVNKKDKTTGKTEEVLFDFNKVEELLITPSLAKVNLQGGTTGIIFEAGEIREDMFSLLLLADIVIADITIHNANVFYELGIRHALRDKKTVLIKSAGFDETPFDILGYRYVSYEKDDPAKSIPQLVQTLQETLLANRKDSPVFNMLPKLEAQETERFLAVPNDFGEEVEIAKASRQIGKLALLAFEARDFAWENPALRVVGESQYRLKDFENAQISWEKIRNKNPDDSEANDRLATIYQRLAETEMKSNPVSGWELLSQSDMAIKRLLDNYTKLDRYKRSEVYALRARNAKVRWLDTWKQVPEGERRAKALQSTFLRDAFEDYERGYNEDLNHFYSGVNALGMLTVIISLAESLPDTWELEYDTKEDADSALMKYKGLHKKLATVVQASVDAEKKRVEREGKGDPWLNMTEADLACLTIARLQRVGSLYQKVIQESNDLNFEAAKRQLLIYEQLGVLPDNVKAALTAFSAAQVFEETGMRHYLLFTGHMIDKADRPTPRFPPDKVEVARAAIKEAVQKEKEKIEGPVLGIAGGACGGDILFHEVCEELNIPTELLLALPREKFLVESVQFAGPDWVERFDKLYKKLPRKVLSEVKELPKWLQKKSGYSVWQRNNLWMLYNALVCGGIQMTLIALWDGKGGDETGGTEHMVQEANKKGAKTIVIDMNSI